LREGTINQNHLKSLVIESAKQRAYAQARMRSDRFPRYRGVLKLEREKVVNLILAVAKEHRAAIGVEDVAGVEKSTWIGQANLLRSHWDFGKIADSFSYKSALTGLPVVGRKRKRDLFRISSFKANFTCSVCGFTNAGKPNKDHLIAVEDGQIYCGNCGHKQDKDQNAARVVAVATKEFFLKKRK